MTFCCSEPRPASFVTTRAPVRVICQPVAPMRAASIGNGTRSSLATSRCLVVLIASSLSKSAVTRKNGVDPITLTSGCGDRKAAEHNAHNLKIAGYPG